MRKELKEQILTEFPKLFGEHFPSFDCGDGWFQLIYNLCGTLAILTLPEDYKILAIKQKYGGLCLWGDPYNEEITELLYECEQASLGVCERCGTTQGVKYFIHRGWEQVACHPCRKMIKAGWQEGCAEFSPVEKEITRDILKLIQVRLDSLIQDRFPGGTAKLVLASKKELSHIMVKDAEGRVFAC